MQRLEVSGAVRLIYRSLGVKGLRQPSRAADRRNFVKQKQCPHFRKGWQPLVLRSISKARTTDAQNITMLHTAQSVSDNNP